MNNAGPAIATKIFQRGTLPVFKAAGTSKHELAQWIKLSLYFECPAIKRGRLFLDFAPFWPEHYMTGILAVGFGLHATLIAKYRRYMKHEFLISAILGRQTYDHYSGSPVLNEYPYRHLSVETIRSALGKFVGSIEQSYPAALLQERQFGQASSIDSALQTVGDGVQITHPADDKNSDRGEDNDDDDELDERNDNNNHHEYDNNNLERPAAAAAAAAVGRHPTLRIKQCHSIELLKVDGAVVQMRIISDGLFSCRALVRDLGLELGCHAVIDQLHLKSIGPFGDEEALHKHELHAVQIERALTENAERSQKYFSRMKDQYPDATSTYRFI